MVTEFFPNENCMAFHGQKRLTDSMIVSFESKGWRRYNASSSTGILGFIRRLLFGREVDEMLREEAEEQEALSPLVDDLFAIEGITKVTVYPYHVSLVKGKAFSWGDLSYQVEMVLKKHGVD